jgi:hypothetical protein
MSKNGSQHKGISGRDPKSGQFVMGHTGIGGRPKGSRNVLGEQFLLDLRQEWERSGQAALARVAHEFPAVFVKVVAGLLPKQVDETLSLNVSLIAERDYAECFAFCLKHIGSEIEFEPELIEADGDTPD